MNNIKQWLIEYNQSKGWGTTDADLFETLQECGKLVSEETIDSRRHWDEIEKVVKIEDKYISYGAAYTTGDLSPREAGWEFDINTIQEVFPQEETITKIVYK